MKKFSKILSVALLVALVLSLGVANAFAEGETGTITIQNAAMGETYSAYKLFDAYLGDNGAISYKGTIPTSLADYFTTDAVGNILKNTEKTDAQIAAAVQAWAAALTESVTPEASEVAGGGPLVLTVPYGYYAVTSSQGSVVSVDSTNPNAEIFDKNEKDIELSKTVDDPNVKIGQTVTYTVVWNAPNYLGAGDEAEQVTKYTIEDTLPDFLSNVTVTSLKIGETEMITKDAETGAITVAGGITGVDTFGTAKKIVIPWVDGTTSLYKNNSTITLTYTAVVTDKVDTTSTGNENKVTLTPTTTTGDKQPKEDTEKIYSYNFGLKKVNEKGDALAGATFELTFYVKQVGETNVYLYAGTEASEGAVNTVTTPAGGEIYIKGIATDETTNTEEVKNTTFTITETVAPDGYNKLTASFDVVCTPVWNQTVTRYYDADGKLVNTVVENGTTNEDAVTVPVAGFQDVINNKGSVLPSTGGIGTTIFYVVGGVLVLAAIILLVTKKRMSD